MPDPKPRGIHKRILSQRKALARTVSKGPLEPESPQSDAPITPITPTTPQPPLSAASTPTTVEPEDVAEPSATEEPLESSRPPEAPTTTPTATSQTPAPTTPATLPSPIPPTPKSPPLDLNKPLPLPTPTISTALSTKDFSFLLDPACYTKLQVGNLESSIYQTSKLPSLISRGHFDAAADLLVRILISETSVQNPVRILELFYLRLLVLGFSSRADLGVEESGLLGELGDIWFRDESTGFHVLDWELRLVVTGVGGRPFEGRMIDSRGVVIGYYEMVKEARRRLFESHGASRAEWKARLEDLGWRVAVQLLRMGDVPLVREHLDALLSSVSADTSLRWRLATASLFLRVERPGAAEECLTKGKGWFGNRTKRTQVLRALELTARWELDKAAATWRSLGHESKERAPDERELVELYEAHCYRCMEEHSALQGDGNPLAAVFATGRPLAEVLLDLYTLQELYE